MADFKRLGEVLDAAREAPPPAISQPGNDTPPAKIRGVPRARWETDSFENFELARNPTMKPAVEACRAVASGERWSCFLTGGFGNGKTHLAIAAMREHGACHYFWKVPDFLSWVRRSVFDEGWELDHLLGSYREPPGGLVVFDDLGAENATDWACEQLYRVLDSRYDSKLPTIITSNSPLAAIDGRILSRFREGLVVCRGQDVRAPKREEREAN